MKGIDEVCDLSTMLKHVSPVNLFVKRCTSMLTTVLTIISCTEALKTLSKSSINLFPDRTMYGKLCDSDVLPLASDDFNDLIILISSLHNVHNLAYLGLLVVFS